MDDWHTNLERNGIGNAITPYQMSAGKCQLQDLLRSPMRKKSLYVSMIGKHHLLPHNSLSSTVIKSCSNGSVKKAMIVVQSVMSRTGDFSMETANREREEVEGIGYCGS